MAQVPDLVLCWPGRTAAPYARDGIADYVERIRRFRSCRQLVVREEKGRLSQEERLDREGRTMLERLEAVEPTFVVVVDPEGKMMSSAGFARLLERQCYDDARSLTFLLGGPDGFSPRVRERADLKLSLSSMTLPHDMARLVIVEQIYRGFTLIHGLPYNR